MIPAIHARYVLDASVAAKWFTRHEEPDREKALALRDRHRRRHCRLILPELGLIEVMNAIRFSRRAVEADTSAALAVLNDLQLDITPADWDLLPGPPAFSPDGRFVYFAAGIGGNDDLFRVAPNTPHVEQITTGERHLANFS